MSSARRIIGYDYSAPGWYFITAVTADRAPLLGRLIAQGGMVLSPIGFLVQEAWATIPTIRRWITLDAFVIMPDHVHGLLRVGRAPAERSAALHVVVNGFKGAVTRAARTQSLIGERTALWQRSYDVRFLVTERALNRARRYILDNPWRALASAAYQAAPPDNGDPTAAAQRAADC